MRIQSFNHSIVITRNDTYILYIILITGTSVTVITASVLGSFFATMVIIILACLCVIWKSNSLRKGRAVYTHDTDLGPEHDNIPELDVTDSVVVEPASPSFHNLSRPNMADNNI